MKYNTKYNIWWMQTLKVVKGAENKHEWILMLKKAFSAISSKAQGKVRWDIKNIKARRI